MTDAEPTIIELDTIDRPTMGRREGWVVHYREKARGWVTAALIGLFAVIILYPMIAVPVGWVTFEQAVRLLSLLVPAVSGILGAVVGFYFGASTESK